MPIDPVEEDEKLLAQAQRGDIQAFGLLYERYAQPVFRYLFAHLDSRMDAEDMTGDVFLRVWQALPGYKVRGAPFLAYLLRVARNTLIDHYRRSKQTRQVASLETEAEQPDGRLGPAGEYSQAMQRDELKQALKSLREEQRTVLALRFLDGLNVEETAHVMRRSAISVRVLQHRALAALRKVLPPEVERRDEQEEL